MNYEKQKPVDAANVEAYKKAIANSDPYANMVEAARGTTGYEGVFDPDKAVAELGRLVVEDAEDALNPQHQPDYEELEGGRFDFLDEVAADPMHTADDALSARQSAEASVTSHEDGAHTLSWETRPEITTNNSGQVVQNHTEPGQ